VRREQNDEECDPELFAIAQLGADATDNDSSKDAW
jgi:hypothetical protein